jgi:hypothetical protein
VRLGRGEAELIEETTAELTNENRRAASEVALFKNLLMEATLNLRILL